MAKYIVETDGLMLGVINEDELQILQEHDTNGYRVYKANKDFRKNIQRMKSPWYKFSVDENNEFQMKQLPEIDKKAENLYYINDALEYITDNTSHTEVEKYLDLYNSIIDSEEEYFGVTYFADEIKLPDNHPERTAESKARSEAMMEALIQELRRV